MAAPHMAALVATSKIQQLPKQVTVFSLFSLKLMLMQALFLSIWDLFLKEFNECIKKYISFAENIITFFLSS